MLHHVVRWFATEDRLVAASILRVGLGTVLLQLYLLHYPYRHFLWGPNAFVPYDLFIHMLERTSAFSLYAYSESPVAFEAIFHCGITVTVFWTLGAGTRFTGALSYLFAFSLWERNGFILDGGDNILIVCMFFLLFARTDQHLVLPAFKRFHFFERRFRWLGHTRRTVGTSPSLLYESGTVLHNAAMVAILVQVSFLYLASGLNKVQGEMWQSGVALYYVLRVQEFTWPGISHYIYQNSFLVVALTYLTVLEQIAYPFMLLNRWTKRVSVFIAVQMHVGIGLLMGLMSFSAVMLTLQAPAFRDDEYHAAIRRLSNLKTGFVLRTNRLIVALGAHWSR